MATITEDFVSFETAKLLKEKGFNELCAWQYYTYWEGEKLKSYKNPILLSKMLNNSNVIDRDNVTAPTLQMAMKWLREVHNICIEPYRTACGYLHTISTIPYGSCKCNPKEGGDDEDSGQWTTYEGTCEAAIKYCLEHLI